MARRQNAPTPATGASDAWRSTPEAYRALVVRNRADIQFLAVEQQHTRLLTFCRSTADAGGLLSLSSEALTIGLNDLDFYLVAIRRLLRVGQLIRRSALPTSALRGPIKTYEDATKNVTKVRDALEHLDEVTAEGRGGIGAGIGADRMTVTYNGVSIDSRRLFDAARDFHAAVRRAVDPIAEPEPHNQPPIIDLTLRQGDEGLPSDNN